MRTKGDACERVQGSTIRFSKCRRTTGLKGLVLACWSELVACNVRRKEKHLGKITGFALVY